MGTDGQVGEGTKNYAVSTGVYRQYRLAEAKQCFRDRLRSVQWVYKFQPFELGKKRDEARLEYREQVEKIMEFCPRDGAR